MKTNLFLAFFLAICAGFCANAAADDVIFNEKIDKSKGDTNVTERGTVTILDSGSMKASVNIRVRKSGLAGSGKGVLSLVLYDEDGMPFRVVNAGATVGARVPQGVNHKNNDASLTLFPAFVSKISSAQLIPTIGDDKGFSTSVPDLIEKVGDLNKRLSDAGLPSLSDLAGGQVVELGDTILKKF